MEYGDKVGVQAAEAASAYGKHGDINIMPLVESGDKYGEISFHSPFRFYAPLAVAGYKGG